MRIRLKTFLLLAMPLLMVVAAAYIQWGTVGLPALPASPVMTPAMPTQPDGFPAWLRITHYVNFLFVILLIRSGLQILADHPRLYWNVHCTPGTEWLRLTPVEVPKDRLWTAKEDSRYLSPWIGLPGYRHTVGMARHWHFLSVLFWVGNGLIYVVLLLYTDQWKRLVPTSWQIVPDAWAVFVHYATFHLPPEPNGFYHYNALQQLAYFAVVFVLTPLAMLTGPSMSPAFTARFTWYPKLPANRQVGRSIHFLIMCAFVVFIIAHVTMVALTGFVRNMNHIVVGTDNSDPIGLYLGLAGVGVVILLNVFANWMAWRHPRAVQHAAKAIVGPVMSFLLDRPVPIAEFGRKDISPFFWVNGNMPTCVEWKTLAASDFKGYRLKVYGQVQHPVELSLDDLRALGQKTQITLHHCIQGWSGIAEWGGLPLTELMKLVRPEPNVKAVVFYSFSEGVVFSTGVAGGQYYDSLSIENALDPQTLLAYEMNDQPLNPLHGAPLRLRVENQLGFKMVKWIQAIEFVEDVESINQGEGGYAEDHEYFGELANI
ncbi:MAG TPA: molybdopterin-dependent oxidoreductase [Planctomycetaceae bacterium]|jgi:thiosulfate reductase cytochrome b subunit|nr:molybdopterin-dependent oxidoreductase [Planctomycetaceae bacterium]